jgi:hypothetical protein
MATDPFVREQDTKVGGEKEGDGIFELNSF